MATEAAAEAKRKQEEAAAEAAKAAEEAKKAEEERQKKVAQEMNTLKDSIANAEQNAAKLSTKQPTQTCFRSHKNCYLNQSR